MNTPTTAFALPRSFALTSRAQFSPVRSRVGRHSLAAARLDHTDRDSAQRSFLSRWSRPAFIDRLQPMLTRHHE